MATRKLKDDIVSYAHTYKTLIIHIICHISIWNIINVLLLLLTHRPPKMGKTSLENINEIPKRIRNGRHGKKECSLSWKDDELIGL